MPAVAAAQVVAPEPCRFTRWTTPSTWFRATQTNMSSTAPATAAADPARRSLTAQPTAGYSSSTTTTAEAPRCRPGLPAKVGPGRGSFLNSSNHDQLTEPSSPRSANDSAQDGCETICPPTPC